MLRGFSGAGHHALRWRRRAATIFPLTGPSLPGGWTFTRASSGTQIQSGVLSNATTNVARFETSPAGWLGEPQGTNLQFQSNGLTTAPWTLLGGLTLTNVTGPDGATTAWSGTLDFVANSRFYSQANGLTALSRYEPSVWIKPTSASGVFLIENPASAASGLWTVATGSLTLNVWQRLTRNHPAVTVTTEFSATAGGLCGNYYHMAVGTMVAAFAYPMLEVGTFSTSPITTTTTSATRAADNLTLDLTQLPGLQTAGGYGVALEFSLLSNSQSNVVFGMAGSGGFSNTWYFTENGAGGLVLTTIVAGVGQGSAAATLRAVGLTNRLALTVTPAGITFNLNGAGDVTVTNAGMPTMTTLAVLRAPWAAGNYEAGHATLVTLVPGPQSAAWRASRSY